MISIYYVPFHHFYFDGTVLNENEQHLIADKKNIIFDGSHAIELKASANHIFLIREAIIIY